MDLFLFTLDPAWGRVAAEGGFDAIVVDWESADKEVRQRGHDTEINRGGDAELVAMREAAAARLVCRIDNRSGRIPEQVERAVAAGADELWLPMVRGADEVEACLRRLDGRAALGVVAETREAAGLGRDLAALPLARVFFGLNDYRIDVGHRGLFAPLLDGTVDRFREHYPGPFGVAGITRVDGGAPVPQDLLLAEMVRLGCAFGVARRTFRGEVGRDGVAAAVEGLRERIAELASRDPAAVRRDREALTEAIRALDAAEPAG